MQVTVNDVIKLIERLRDDLYPRHAGVYEREVLDILKAHGGGRVLGRQYRITSESRGIDKMFNSENEAYEWASTEVCGMSEPSSFIGKVKFHTLMSDGDDIRINVA